jgi:hypothetical protein
VLGVKVIPLDATSRGAVVMHSDDYAALIACAREAKAAHSSWMASWDTFVQHKVSDQ